MILGGTLGASELRVCVLSLEEGVSGSMRVICECNNSSAYEHESTQEH